MFLLLLPFKSILGVRKAGCKSFIPGVGTRKGKEELELGLRERLFEKPSFCWSAGRRAHSMPSPWH